MEKSVTLVVGRDEKFSHNMKIIISIVFFEMRGPCRSSQIFDVSQLLPQKSIKISFKQKIFETTRTWN